MGGLGNQLFQIFTTLAYAIRFKRKMILPYSYVLTVGIDRPTYWETFLSSLKKYTVANPEYGLKNDDLYSFPQYREPHHHYFALPNIKNEKILLFGYYQSYKYFEHETQQIFSFINIKEQQDVIREQYSNYFENSICTSMHFRLGDYKEKQDYHPLMPYQYYDNAILNLLLNCSLKNAHRILYFCEKEDNDIVSQIIIKLQRKYAAFEFVKIDDSIDDWRQLLIMSCCNNNIIANSSFSWWAGYFNQNNDKIVCYPQLWFGPKANNNIADMFPETWNRIEW
jgi:hypothetical protein